MRAGLILICLVAAGAAAADECDVLTADVIRRTGATFERRSPSGGNVFLRHPVAQSLSFGCPDRLSANDRNVFASAGALYPKDLFFVLAAETAAAVVGATGPEIKAAALKCQRLALRDADEQGTVELKGVRVECQIHRRDGGGTSISIAPRVR